ncbi:MAG: S9 family peptidase [Elusimicrobia bacterium]|nr:S9 family peptidase [Elusimicrobiota bacterium]
MRKVKKGVAVTLLAAGVAPLAPAPPAQGAEPPLIPRDVLFGNPVKASPRISPDGKKLAFLAPSKDGVLNVWVKTIGKEDDGQVTDDRVRGVRMFRWAEDGAHLLYLQDIGGDENWHVYSARLATKIVRDLTPFQGVRAQNLMTDRRHPDEVLVGLNLRDRRVFDMYRIDLKTGAAVLDVENPGDVVEWLTDADFVIRGAVANDLADGSKTLRVRDLPGGKFRGLVTWPFGENGDVFAFTKDGREIVAASSLGSDTTRLVKLSLKDGKETALLAANEKSDVWAVLVNPDTFAAEAVAFNTHRVRWEALDPKVEGDLASVGRLCPGDFEVVSRDRADKVWIVAFDRDDGPVAWYAYDRRTRKGEFLFVNHPELEKHRLAKMTPVAVPARDGVALNAYLTLPVGRSLDKPSRLPIVLMVHGGPWGRDTWGFDPQAQWLANRGYAVLSVNFRGSTGYGKSFLNAGNKEWGVGAMQHDLTDAVKWAVEDGVADPEKVCIYGGSYGGYATLAGLAFTPELYRCGVDIVGPSNVKTLFESIPPYWAPMKSEFVLRVGDVEKDDDLNRRISPMFHADRIRAPLLIGQGQNDPRVKIRESDQMVKAMRERKLPVDYVVYTDEGHGFARPENRLDFYGRVDEFLAKQLGGRKEPWKKVDGSTAEAR